MNKNKFLKIIFIQIYRIVHRVTVTHLAKLGVPLCVSVFVAVLIIPCPTLYKDKTVSNSPGRTRDSLE